MNRNSRPLPPSRIKIGGMWWTLRIVDSGFFSDDDSLGECCFVEQKISILDALSRQKERHVVMHEGAEAVVSTHLLEVTHEQMHGIVLGILQMLDDNPGLRDYLWPKG